MLKKITEFIKKFDWSVKSIAKMVALLFAGVVLLAVALAILGMIVRFVFMGTSSPYKMMQTQSHSIAMPMMGEMMDGLEDMGLMARKANIVTSMPEPYFGGGVSEEMEDYEKVSYNAGIERYKIEPVCNSIEALKPLDYVVFKNASRNERNCSYRFSVESEREEEIADLVRNMSPESFDINISTREPAVSGNVFEREILTERLESIQDSLKQAESAYDKAITLATSRGNVESLATLINGKLNLMERLGNQKRSVAQQLARLARSGERTISETEYAHFAVQISKKQIVDWKSITFAWRDTVHGFVSNVSNILQDITFGLIVLVLIVLKFFVYLFVLIAFARLAWTLAKRIWKWDSLRIRRLKK